MFDQPQYLAIFAGATGGAIAIASMEAFSTSTAFPLMAIPFATSIVTVLGSLKAEPAQPRALIGGHLISTIIGLLIVKVCRPAPWAAAMAVGLAMIAMQLTGAIHPLAGIDPLAVVVNNMSWSFLVAPIGMALCCSRCSPSFHAISSREALKGVILGQYGGGGSCCKYSLPP